MSRVCPRCGKFGGWLEHQKHTNWSEFVCINCGHHVPFTGGPLVRRGVWRGQADISGINFLSDIGGVR